MSNNLIVAVVIGVVFVILAVKNWRRDIGAGPTILIVGALILFGYWGFSYSRHQDEVQRAQIKHDGLVADYNACASKVDRSAGNREMWEYVRDLFSPSPEVTADFNAHLDNNLPALTLTHDCSPKP